VNLIYAKDAWNAQPSTPVFSFLGITAMPPLLALLDKQSSPTTHVCERVQFALSYYRTDEAIPLYLAYLANSNACNRRFVVRLICLCPLATNTAPAVNTLIDCLTNSDRELALEARGAICSPPVLETQGIFASFLSTRLAASEDPIVRSNIVRLFGDMGLRCTLPAVEAALTDHDPSVRIAATNVFQDWIRSVPPFRQADLSRRLSQP
jgi:HEAT repeat protein